MPTNQNPATALINSAIDTLVYELFNERAYRRELSSYYRPNLLDASTRQHLEEKIKKIYDLVQSLPTTDELPTNKEENMLRAIMAVLRTGGHEGAEKLTWEEVTGNGAKKSESSTEDWPGTSSIDTVATTIDAVTYVSGTVGDPVPAGSVVIEGDDGDDEDSGDDGDEDGDDEEPF